MEFSPGWLAAMEPDFLTVSTVPAFLSLVHLEGPVAHPEVWVAQEHQAHGQVCQPQEVPQLAQDSAQLAQESAQWAQDSVK